MSHEVVEDGEVGVPAVEYRSAFTQPNGFGLWVPNELVTNATPGDNDAGLTVSTQEHAESASVKMELAHVPSTRERVPYDDDFEFSTLKHIGCVDDDLIDRDSCPFPGLLQRCADMVALVVVRDADCDVAGPKRSGPILVFDGDPGGEKFAYDFDYGTDGVRIGLGHRRVVEF